MTRLASEIDESTRALRRALGSSLELASRLTTCLVEAANHRPWPDAASDA
jgi:hypothetical protein